MKEGLQPKNWCHSLIIFLRPYFLQLNFISSVSHETLTILKWATMKTYRRGYLWVWESSVTRSKVSQLHHFANATCVSMCKRECTHMLKLHFLTFSTSFDVTWYAQASIYREKSPSISCHNVLLFHSIRGRGLEKKRQSVTCRREGQKMLFCEWRTFWMTCRWISFFYFRFLLVKE